MCLHFFLHHAWWRECVVVNFVFSECKGLHAHVMAWEKNKGFKGKIFFSCKNHKKKSSFRCPIYLSFSLSLSLSFGRRRCRYLYQHHFTFFAVLFLYLQNKLSHPKSTPSLHTKLLVCTVLYCLYMSAPFYSHTRERERKKINKNENKRLSGQTTTSTATTTETLLKSAIHNHCNALSKITTTKKIKSHVH